MLSDLTHRVPGAEGSGKSSIGIDIEFRSLEKLWFSAYFHWNREIHEEGSVLGWAKLVFFVILEHENAYQKQKNTPKIAGLLSCPRHRAQYSACCSPTHVMCIRLLINRF